MLNLIIDLGCGTASFYLALDFCYCLRLSGQLYSTSNHTTLGRINTAPLMCKIQQVRIRGGVIWIYVTLAIAAPFSSSTLTWGKKAVYTELLRSPRGISTTNEQSTMASLSLRIISIRPLQSIERHTLAGLRMAVV